MELERDVEQRLTRRVEALDGVCLKHGQDGWPDRIVMLPGGVLVWVELKRSTGKLSDLQQYRRRQLEQVGQRVQYLWSVDAVDGFIDGLMQR
jgi:hypothetical protein